MLESSGGHGANCASLAASLGAQVHIFGSVGQDDSGDRLLSELASSGICVDGVVRDPDLPTGRVFIPYDKKFRCMLMHRGANDSLIPHRQLERISEETPFDVYLVLDPGPSLFKSFIKTRKLHNVIQIWSPGGLWARHDDLARYIDLFDILIFNRSEYQSALERGAVGASSKALQIVTEGAKGAWFVPPDGTLQAVPTSHVETIDSTGAGDAFVAAFTLCYASGCFNVADAIAVGCRAGAAAVGQRGARANHVSLDEILRAAPND